jgi:hypothetical protein
VEVAPQNLYAEVFANVTLAVSVLIDPSNLMNLERSGLSIGDESRAHICCIEVVNIPVVEMYITIICMIHCF